VGSGELIGTTDVLKRLKKTLDLRIMESKG